jgi:peroxiredoxin
MKRTFNVIIVSCLVTGMLVLTGGCGTEKLAAVGSAAPDFQLPDINGQLVSLSQFIGKPVLLYVWATWSPPCKQEMTYLQQVYDEKKCDGLVVLAVSVVSSENDVADFIAENDYTFTVLIDSESALLGQYSVKYVPHTYLIDREGILQLIQRGIFKGKADMEANLTKILG